MLELQQIVEDFAKGIELAAYGDHAIDVAYCRMDMCLVGMDETADHFRKPTNPLRIDAWRT